MYVPIWWYISSSASKNNFQLSSENCFHSPHVVGFHMTSLKFKLKNYRSYGDFYFHDALEQLKTNFHANFSFKRVLGFVLEYAWISKLLRDAAFTWRPRKTKTYFRKFCYLNSSCIRKSVTLMFMSFSKKKITLL